MPYGGLFFGGLVAFAFHRVQVEQFGASHVFQLPQHAHQPLYIVPVERPKVAYVHAFENVLLVGYGRLQRVAQSDESLSAVVVHHAARLEPVGSLKTQRIVGFVGVEVEQVLFHAAHRAVDAHVVVVEDDEQVVGRRRGVVEALESQSAAHGTVADDGHHVAFANIRGLTAAVAAAFHLVGHSHAEGCRDGV